MIKPLIAAIGLSLCLAGTAFAEDAKKPMTAQQTRMKDCNQQATGKKGDERKAFMKSCLSGKADTPAPAAAAAEPAKPASPQDRMKDCNQQATGKKGDERKAFMKSCLSGKADAPAPAAAAPATTAEPAKPASPKDRMKDCNQQATGKKGDERKAFMKSCLAN